jgi:hypothetical protein
VVATTTTTAATAGLAAATAAGPTTGCRAPAARAETAAAAARGQAGAAATAAAPAPAPTSAALEPILPVRAVLLLSLPLPSAAHISDYLSRQVVILSPSNLAGVCVCVCAFA